MLILEKKGSERTGKGANAQDKDFSCMDQVTDIIWAAHAQAVGDPRISGRCLSAQTLINRSLEGLSASLLHEQVFSVIPPTDDMIGRATIFDPQFSRHEVRLPTHVSFCRSLSCAFDPFFLSFRFNGVNLSP